jgi:hypothetical protein
MKISDAAMAICFDLGCDSDVPAEQNTKTDPIRDGR